MRIFEAIFAEIKRLESVSNEQFNKEMETNEDFGILVFAAKDEIESIAWVTLKVPVLDKDVEDKNRVNQIIERVLNR